jgi:rhamnogalacturonyl hydrolase YesR
MWRASLLDPASYPIQESSASGLILFGLAWGVNQGILPRERFQRPVEHGWLALNENVRPDGKLTKVQPIGADPKHFDPDETQMYGVGAFLMAGAEIYRLGAAGGPGAASVAHGAAPGHVEQPER